MPTMRPQRRQAKVSLVGNDSLHMAQAILGPADNYLVVPALGKWLLASLMIVGRLEILPILILFNRELWRR